MQWPGTTAVLEGTASLTGEPAEQTPSTSILEQVLTGATATLADVPGGLDLPCRDDPELFFAESPDDVEFAKSLCMGCAARITCLAGAMERREPWGVWGGQLFLRGEVVPFKRPRGRPRKATVAA
jgi:WhiB family transcriptional regulator, redox-sensing transcriptional regulator